MLLRVYSRWHFLARPNVLSLSAGRTPSRQLRLQSTASHPSRTWTGGSGEWKYQDFANHFRSTQARRSERDRHAERWRSTLDPADRALQKSILAKPQEAIPTLLSLIERSSASPHAIRICLETAHTFSQEANAVEVPAVARPLLSYLLNDSSRWLPLVYHADSTQSDICYFAIREDLGSFVEKWILTPLSQEELVTAVPHIPKGSWTDSWRGLLLRSLVDAHLRNTPGNADEAINCRFRILRGMQQVRAWDRGEGNRAAAEALRNPRSGPATTSTDAADMTIMRHLIHTEFARTSVAKFEGFLSAMKRHGANSRQEHKVSRDINLAMLPTAHPTKPDETSFVHLLRNMLFDPELVESLSSRFRGYLLRPIRRSMTLAAEKGRTEDAAWLQQLLQQHPALRSKSSMAAGSFSAMLPEFHARGDPSVRRVYRVTTNHATAAKTERSG